MAAVRAYIRFIYASLHWLIHAHSQPGTGECSASTGLRLSLVATRTLVVNGCSFYSAAVPSSVVGLALAAAWFVIALAAVESMLHVVGRLVVVNSTPAAIAALALGPTVLAGFFVIGLFVPAQLTWEPAGAAETLNITVIGLCAAAATMLMRTARRAVRMLAVSDRFVRRLAVSERLDSVHVRMPVLVVEDVFPVAMLVGIVSSKIVIARRFKEALVEAELEAVLAHEMAHHARRDNLMRFALECAPAVWSSQMNKWTGRWREASDITADVRVANDDPERAIALASALVKACRFMEDGSRLIPISSSIYSGAPIARRVIGLLEATSASRARASRRITAFVIVGAALAGVTIYPFALITVHRVSEWLLNGLP